MSGPQRASHVRAIIFDLDGTLIDSQEDILAAFSHAFAGLSVQAPSRAELLSVIGRRLEDCFSQFVGGNGADGARLFRAWYQEHYLDHTRPYPGTGETLKNLSAVHPLALCTMKKFDFARRLVRHFRWEGLFKTVLGSEEGFAAKPSPDMLMELCGRLRVLPGEALYVGDTALDARMAAAAAMPFAFAAWGYGSTQDVEGLPVHRVLHRLEDLRPLL